jgi:uncharacterized protein
MKIPESDLVAVLRQMNPWWQGKPIEDLPSWKRAAFAELELWLTAPPAPRAILLSGARQIGKTTLFLQAIEGLLRRGIPPQNILYLTFDHPLLKLAGLEAVLQTWRGTEPAALGEEYLFIDEIQFLPDWQTWVKHQVDFQKQRRVAMTGSATPLLAQGQESGVGRWHTIRLATLSFYEFLMIRKTETPPLPEMGNLASLFSWAPGDFARVAAVAQPLVGHFHEYLQRGGFPQCAQAPSVTWAQKLLREDIVDKVLKRDMTALFGVRRVVELEHTFLYLCLHDGGILDLVTMASSLGVPKPTVQNFIELLVAVHLAHKLPPYGYGKEVLRGKHKVYLSDAALSPSVLSKGKALLEDDTLLGTAVETAIFKHLVTRYYGAGVSFSYWRGKKDHEVDMIADVEGRLVPFEVKYRGQETEWSELRGMEEFCQTKGVKQGYVVTRSLSDFGPLAPRGTATASVMRIPAPLFCYWLGKHELLRAQPSLSQDSEGSL